MARIRCRIVLAIFLLVGLQGCATLTRGSLENFEIQTSPAGASVRASTGWRCVTPCEIQIKRVSAFAIDVEKAGYQPVRVLVKPERERGGKLALTGNILFGGFVGLAIDGMSGAAHGHLDNPLHINLEGDDLP